MKKRTWGLLGGIALMGVIGIAAAGMGPHGCGGHGFMHKASMHPMHSMMQQLDLSDEQRSQMRAVIKEHRRSLRSDREAMLESRQTLMSLILADELDKAELEKAIHAQADTIAARLTDRIPMIEAMAKVLTPEQRQALLEMKPKAHHPAVKHWGL